MPVTVQFGTIVFPCNPETMQRVYRRALPAKTLLGFSERLESRKLELSTLSFSGVLAGDDAKSTRTSLKAEFEAGSVKKFIAPTIPSPGEDAFITSVRFRLQRGIYYYWKWIPYDINLIFTPSVITPEWDVKVEDPPPNPDHSLSPVEDLLSFTMEDNAAAMADTFSITLDNRKGQNAHPELEGGRQVQIAIKQGGVMRRKMWGLIDAVDYSATKDRGSIVTARGRDYTARLLEGSHFDREYNFYRADLIIKDIIDGGVTGVDYGWWNVPWGHDTGIGKNRVQQVDDSITLFVTIRGETRLDAIAKVSEIMPGRGFNPYEYYVDNGVGYAEPQLIWKPGPPPWGGEPPYIVAKTWGQNICSLDIRRSIIPQRRIIRVYGKGWWAVADTNDAQMYEYDENGNKTYYDTEGQPHGYWNPDHIAEPEIETKYHTREEIVQDSSLQSREACDAFASVKLMLLKEPEMEVKVEMLGDASDQVVPENGLSFTDAGLTGLADAYRITQVTHVLDISGGFVTEALCRGAIQVTSTKTLGSALQTGAQSGAAGDKLLHLKAQFPVIGRVVKVLPE